MFTTTFPLKPRLLIPANKPPAAVREVKVCPLPALYVPDKAVNVVPFISSAPISGAVPVPL